MHVMTFRHSGSALASKSLFFNLILLFLIYPATASPFSKASILSILHRQESCVQSDVLLAFERYENQTYPFCRSLLGIVDATTTLPPATERTWVLVTS